MKLLACCLLVIIASAVMAAPVHQKSKKIREVLSDLKKINQSVVPNGLMLNTPLMDDIKSCCSASALKCFIKQLPMLKTTNADKMKKFQYNLGKPMVEKSMDSCNDKDTKNASCQACESYSKRDSKEFMQALETLLQKTYTRLRDA